jgi:hypothetical protein
MQQPIVSLDHQACLDMFGRVFLYMSSSTRHLTPQKAAVSFFGKIEGLHWDQ